jgi:hypothetical protein
LTSTEIGTHASAVFRFRYAACVVVLAGCPAEQKPDIEAKDAGSTPISRPITSTGTATVSAVDPPPQNVIEPPAACSGAPMWATQPPCTKDGFLYASGELQSESKTYAARSAVANRARKRLALALGAHENDTFTLQGSEIDQIFVCEGAMYALARVKHAGKGELRTCTAESLAMPPPAKGCPKWVSRMAWMDGDTLYGVAPAFKVMQKFQAEQAAVNRARQVVAEMLEVELALTPEGVTATTKSTPLREKRRSSAECKGARWMLVAFERGAGEPNAARPQLKGPASKMSIK